MCSSNSAYLCQLFDADIPTMLFLPWLGVVSQTKPQLPHESGINVTNGSDVFCKQDISSTQQNNGKTGIAVCRIGAQRGPR